MLAQLRKIVALSGKCIAPALGERLMQMPAARHDVRQFRPAHERGVIAVAPRDLLDRAAQEHHRICGRESWQRREREFELARAELHFEGAQRQPELLEPAAQELYDRIELVVA